MSRENRPPGVRGLLGTVAGLDLVGGLVRTFPPGGLPDGALGALGSLAIGVLAGGVLGWVIVGAVLYHFADRMYPAAAGFPTDERGFRVLFAGSALAIAVTFDVLGTTIAFLLALFGVVVVAGAGFVAYLSIVAGRRLLDPDDPFVQPVEQFFPSADARSEIQADLARTGWLGVVGRGLWLVALAFVAVLPCVLAGFVAIALEEAFPLPDLVVLGWAVLGVVPPAARPDVRERTDDLEIEERVYDVVEHATRNTKAMMLTVYVVSGLFGSGVLLVAAVSIAENVAREILRSDLEFAWAVVGVVASLLASGAYLLWFWLRQYRRIDPFVRRWEGTEADPEPSLPARPLGWTLPPTLVAVAATTAIAGWDASTVRAIAAGWPLLVAFLAVCVLVTLDRGSTRLGREDVAIVASLLVAVVGVAVMGEGDTIRTAVETGTVPSSALDWNVVAGLTVVVLVSLLPDVSRHQNEAEGIGEYSLPAYLLVLSLVTAGLTSVTVGAIRTLTVAMAAITFLAGIALALTRRYGL